MPVDSVFDDSSSDPIDRLVIDLRAYIKRPPDPEKDAKPRRSLARQRWQQRTTTPPSEWVLVFDCETRTTPDQRLRFGAYQSRRNGQIWERGVFYEPDVVSPAEKALLATLVDRENKMSSERVFLRTRATFLRDVFYDQGYAIGA